ncbi:hypothetical protein EYV94_09960 [Puteibacter caeruleilacunae]|nr:hypothetical protein EYV94_09960 [Puteibacter caeruleilacunae]
MIKRYKKSLLAGLLFGIIAPLVVMLLVLHINPVIAIILMGPMVIISNVTEISIYELSLVQIATGVVLSQIMWSLFFIAYTWLKGIQQNS